MNLDPESFRLDGSDPDQTFFIRKEVQFRQLFIVTSIFVFNLSLNIQLTKFNVKKFNILPRNCFTNFLLLPHFEDSLEQDPIFGNSNLGSTTLADHLSNLLVVHSNRSSNVRHNYFKGSMLSATDSGVDQQRFGADPDQTSN